MFLIVLKLFYYCTYACEYIFGGWAALGFELSLTFGKQVLYHLSHLPAYIFLFIYTYIFALLGIEPRALGLLDKYFTT
jgi:hypothetical protein